MFVFETSALITLCVLAWFWVDSTRAREAGVAAARTACEREDVQFLDDTVAFRSLRPARDDDGRLTLKRVYDFEYSSTGAERCRGAVMLQGREVVMIDVTSHLRTLRVVIH